MNSHTIAGIKVKKAVENGAKLILVSNKVTQADEWAALKLDSQDLDVLTQMLHQLTHVKFPNASRITGFPLFVDRSNSEKAETASGSVTSDDTKSRKNRYKGIAQSATFEELKAYCEASKPGEAIVQAVDMYLNAKKAVIVFDQKAISVSAAQILGNITLLALLAGHIGKPRNGIIQLKQNNNSQGLASLGVDTDGDSYVEAIKNQDIRGLLIFGEDMPELDLSRVDLIVVHDTFLTETAKKADVVLPAAGFAETSGTYVNTVGEIRNANAVVKPLVEKNNCELVLELAEAVGYILPYHSDKEVSEAAIAVISAVKPDKAGMVTPEDAPSFVEKGNTHVAYEKFMEYVEREGLAR